MTTEEKVDRIYAKVYNGLSDNVVETRASLKEINGKMDSLTISWTEFIAGRESTCPFSKEHRRMLITRKTDVKYYLTTLIAMLAVLISILI